MPVTFTFNEKCLRLATKTNYEKNVHSCFLLVNNGNYVPAAQNIDELSRLKMTRPELRSRLHHRVPRHPELAQLFLRHQSSLGEQPAVCPRVLLWITGQRSNKLQPVVQLQISKRNKLSVYLDFRGFSSIIEDK